MTTLANAKVATSTTSQARSFAALLRRSDFANKVAQTYATQVIALGLAVITTIVIARALGPAGRGLYAAALAIGMLGVQFGNFGLSASNTYYLAQEPKLLRSVLGNTLLASIGIGSCGAAAVWVFFHLFPRCAIVPGPLLVIGLICVPVGLTYMLCQSMLLALHQVTAYNLIELTNRSVALILIGVIVTRRFVTPESMLIAVLLGQVAGTFWSYLRLSRCFEGLPRPSLSILREHLRISFKAYVILFLSFMVLKADTLLVKWILGAEQTGYYSIAASMADYVLLLPTTIGMILFPKLSGIRDVVEKLRRARGATIGTAFCLLPLLVVSGLVARYAVKVLFGPAFLPAADAFVWLIPGIFTLGVEVVLVQFLNGIGYPPIVMWAWLFSSVANVALNIYVIPRQGIVGASAVSSVTYTLTLVFIVAIVRFRWYKPAAVSEASHA